MNTITIKYNPILARRLQQGLNESGYTRSEQLDSPKAYTVDFDQPSQTWVIKF